VARDRSFAATDKASTDTELVEGGQLLALFIDPDIASPHGDQHNGDQGDNEDEDA
jgi:hypothetical protein